MRRENRNNDAFTLLEMIAAIVLIAALIGAMYTSLFAGYRARVAAERRIKPARDASMALSLIKADMDAVMRPRGVLAAEFIGEYTRDEFGIESHRLIIHTASNIPSGDSPACDIRRVEYALERTNELEETDAALVRRIITNLLAPATPEPVTEILCRGVHDFRVYFFAGGNWHETWDSADMNDTLPRAVEIYIELYVDDVRPAAGEEPQVFSMSRIYPLLPAYSRVSDE